MWWCWHRGMLAELKRYTKTTRVVVGITSSVLILLGHAKLLEMLKYGLPRENNHLKTIWVSLAFLTFIRQN
jgi:hypothetical protein